jgi:hypothetical protein
MVRTEHATGALLLPITQKPIRGLPHVNVKVSSVPRDAPRAAPTLSIVIAEAIPYSASPSSSSAPCAEERRLLKEAFLALGPTLFRDGRLALVIADGTGYKTYDLPALHENLTRAPTESLPFLEVLFLSKLLLNEASRLGANDILPTEFAAWDALASGVLAQLEELENRAYHHYTAYAYLNGPPCDFVGEKLLAGTLPDADGSILLGPATDGHLSHIIEGFGYAASLPAGAYNCNSVLRMPLSAPVLGTLAEYEVLYPRVAERAARTLDVLRIVYPEDIGISALVIEAESFIAPSIRPTYHVQFNPSLNSYFPVRGVYPSTPTRTLSVREIEEVQRLLSAHLDTPAIQGFQVAVQRFRDSYDRHWPDSPGQLLDIAIALEALFLNDGQDKELRYRLALRLARFLDPAGPQRATTFREVKQLYDIRSKVAHGVDLGHGSQKDRESLAQTMESGPRILRRAIRLMIDGQGPANMTGDQLVAFWRGIELS